MNRVEESARRREELVKKIRLVKNSDGVEKACAILDQYLDTHHKNKTEERKNILQLIYQLSQPADIETIHSMIEERFGHISPTTAYYAVRLFMEAKLVRRIELVENGPAFYERTIDVEPHGYTVCSCCGKVKIVSLKSLKSEANKLPATGFHIDDVSLIIHGTCRSCYSKLTKEAKKQKNKK